MKIRILIKWAVLFTLMYLGWMYLEKAIGLHHHNSEMHSRITNLMALPALAIYVLALWEIKKKVYQARINFAQGFQAGLIMSAFILVLGPLRQYITTTYIIPDFFDQSIAHALEGGDTTLEQAHAYFNLKSYILLTLLGDIFMGVVTSVVAALVVRTRKNWLDDTPEKQ
jgi:hypothetical protein